MKTLLDFIPILLFFAAYKLHDLFGVSSEEAIYFATPVLMAATVAQMAIIYWIDKTLTTMHKITLGMILVFGGITLVLHDERFIKWKPTVLYIAIAIGLAFALWVLKKNFLKAMLGSQLELPDPVWHRLNIVWVVYSALMGIVNGYVAAYFSTEAWVSFKLWGYVFPLAFLVGQGLYITPYLKSDDSSAPPKP